jgi:phenylpyruvate tautomerase PptA (4-oxalocrotonate tautomerase family)
MTGVRCPSCRLLLAETAETCSRCGADMRVVFLIGSAEASAFRAGVPTPGRSRRFRTALALAAAAAFGALFWFLGTRMEDSTSALRTPAPMLSPTAPAAVSTPTARLYVTLLCPGGGSAAASLHAALSRSDGHRSDTDVWTCGSHNQVAVHHVRRPADSNVGAGRETRLDEVEGCGALPLVRIEIHKGRPVSERKLLLQAVPAALVEAFAIPANDRTQRVIEHDPENFEIPPGQSENYTLVEITAFPGRSTSAKRTLHKAIVRNLGEVGIPADDILVVLHEPSMENWGIRGGKSADEVDLGFRVDV